MTDITNGWHLKKELSIGHLLTTLMIAITAFGYIVNNEARLTRLESDQSGTIKRLDQWQAWQDQRFASIEASQIRIEARIERLALPPSRAP